MLDNAKGVKGVLEMWKKRQRDTFAFLIENSQTFSRDTNDELSVYPWLGEFQPKITAE